MTEKEMLHEYYKALEQLENKMYIYINCKEVVIDGKHYLISTKEN